MIHETRVFIGNEWVAPADGSTFPTVDPATEEVIADVALAGPQDIDRAVRAASDAMMGEWGSMPPERRAELIARLGEVIAAHAEEIAELETRDMGKPIRESRTNIVRSVRTFQYYAGAVDKLLGDTIPIGNAGLAFTLYEPVGATAHITPWNYPFANACRSLPIALAAGCTAVIKPASVTPLTTLMLGDIVLEAGLPAGVVNIVTGDGRKTGASLAGHPGIRAITFTGSVETGRRIARAAAERIVPSVLELGGKNPQIVFADADFDLAIAQTMRGALTNAGQVCTSVSRVLVERSLASDFVAALDAKISALRIGPGMEDVDIGPLVSSDHRETVEHYVRSGVDEGGRLVAGGERPKEFDRGYFFKPALFDRVTPDMTIATEEIFGPVLSVIAFNSEDEALAIANSLTLGLTAGVFTRDIARAMRFVRRLEAGMVWVNDWFLSPVQVPHGGVKESGLGREQGMNALLNYVHVKSIGIRT